MVYVATFKKVINAIKDLLNVATLDCNKSGIQVNLVFVISV